MIYQKRSYWYFDNGVSLHAKKCSSYEEAKALEEAHFGTEEEVKEDLSEAKVWGDDSED